MGLVNPIWIFNEDTKEIFTLPKFESLTKWILRNGKEGYWIFDEEDEPSWGKVTVPFKIGGTIDKPNTTWYTTSEDNDEIIPKEFKAALLLVKG